MRIVRSRGRLARLALTASAALLAAACSNSQSTAAESPAAAGTPAPASADIQRLNFTYDKPVVGARVTVSATGLPAGKEAELQWATVTGGWVDRGLLSLPRQEVHRQHHVARPVSD